MITWHVTWLQLSLIMMRNPRWRFHVAINMSRISRNQVNYWSCCILKKNRSFFVADCKMLSKWLNRCIVTVARINDVMIKPHLYLFKQYINIFLRYETEFICTFALPRHLSQVPTRSCDAREAKQQKKNSKTKWRMKAERNLNLVTKMKSFTSIEIEKYQKDIFRLSGYHGATQQWGDVHV